MRGRLRKSMAPRHTPHPAFGHLLPQGEKELLAQLIVNRMPNPSRLIRLGVFGAAQGVRGEVRVNSFTSDPVDIGAYGALTDAAGSRRFLLKVIRPLKGTMVVARVEGVASREAAQAVTGVDLYARRDQLPPPAEGEYYYHDLIGLAAVTREGEAIGKVVDLLNYGAGDILEIEPGGGGETLLLPFNDDVAPEIDFDAGRIVIQPPEIEAEHGD
jgi:16S rRNA processing protein RimM